jgi:hypothetical protein
MELLQAPFLTWLTYEVANSVMMAWLYNATGGSLPIAWAAHVGLSLGQNLVDKHPIPFRSLVLTFCAAALLVVLVNGPRNLARTGAWTKVLRGCFKARVMLDLRNGIHHSASCNRRPKRGDTVS